MSDESTPETPQPSEMAMLRAEMRAGFQSVAKRLVTMDARITDEAVVTRRHFDVVAGGLRESLKGVSDKTTATGEKVDRLIASNAIEHAAFIDSVTDHEVRITQLEKASGRSKSPRS
jgi:hypothetical protein